MSILPVKKLAMLEITQRERGSEGLEVLLELIGQAWN
jgi:hypothetical protein